MARPSHRDLGISNKEYEEAVILERLFKLTKKNSCSTCLLKKPTHVDIDRYELVCSTCSKRCASKVQIGDGIITMYDLERLEKIYGSKPKKLKEQKQKHRTRSYSVSSYSSYDDYKREDSLDSYNNGHYHNKHKSQSKKSKEPQRYSNYEEYSARVVPSANRNTPDGRADFDYYDNRGSPRTAFYSDRTGRDTRYQDLFDTRYHSDRTDPRYLHDRADSRYYEHRSTLQQRTNESYRYPSAPRHESPVYSSPPLAASRRDVPGMVGILATQGQVKDYWPIVDTGRKQSGRSAIDERALATSGRRDEYYPSPRYESTSNNPFAKKPTNAYNFNGMKDVLSLCNGPQDNYREPSRRVDDVRPRNLRYDRF